MKTLKSALDRCFAGIAIALLALTSTSCDKAKGVGKLFGTDSEAVAPTLTTRGTMMVSVGEHPDYLRGVTYDDKSHQVTLSIDTSQVDINHPGSYTVIYTATNQDGASTVKKETLRVLGKSEKIIYLTFDDGPSELTPRVLKVLKEHNVKATFFVTAQFKAHLHYIKDIAEQGHTVAAHTYNHNFKYVYSSIDNYFKDLNKINDVIEQYTGKRTHIMRFPGGSSNTIYKKYNKTPNFMDRLCVALLDSGYQFVDWNLDSGDARGNNRPVASIVASACHTYHPQMCLLMHDTGTASKRTTVEALPTIIKYFKAQGYEFGTLNSVDYVCYHGGKAKVARLQKLRKKGTTMAQPTEQGKVEELPVKVEMPVDSSKQAKTTKPAPQHNEEPEDLDNKATEPVVADTIATI